MRDDEQPGQYGIEHSSLDIGHIYSPPFLIAPRSHRDRTELHAHERTVFLRWVGVALVPAARTRVGTRLGIFERSSVLTALLRSRSLCTKRSLYSGAYSPRCMLWAFLPELVLRQPRRACALPLSDYRRERAAHAGFCGLVCAAASSTPATARGTVTEHHAQWSVGQESC